MRASLKRALMARQLNAHPPLSLDWIAPDFRAEHRMVERAADLMASALRDDPRLSMIEEPYWSDVLTGLGPEGSGSRLKPLHPFFDVRLMSEALRLPVAPWLYRKAILRAVGRPFLPEEVVARRKTPIHASAYARLSGEKDRTARQKLRQPGEIDRYVIRTALLNHSEAVDTASLNSYSDAIPKAADIAAWLAWHRETFNRQGPS